MPPLYPHDPLAAVERGAAWRWVDVPAAFAAVAAEPWVLALVALALLAWLEQEVRDVLAVFVPLAATLALSVALATLAAELGAIPQPLRGGGQAVAPLLRAVGDGQAPAVAALATFALLAYGRRARPALLFALAYAAGRALSGPGWALELAAGALVGIAVGAVACVLAVRLFPAGALARARRARRTAGDAAPAPRSP